MKWMRRIGKSMLVALALLLIAAGVGTVYQMRGAAADMREYAPPGKLYPVAGQRMHLYAAGRGDVTVVMASGWGTASPYADFYPLYAGLEEHVRVAVYDRFGYGFSDTSGRKRDVDTIVDELHELLNAAGEKPPYVLLGHSLGSLEVLRYAQRYPGEAKGIVLEEGGSPEYYASETPMTVIPIVYRALRTTGALRALYHADGFEAWANDEDNRLRLIPEELKAMSRRANLLRAGNEDMTNEIRASRRNARTVLEGRKPLDVPITVLTADDFGKLDEDRAWKDSQQALPSWSAAGGRQAIVKDSRHYIHAYRPDIVVQELLKLAKDGQP